MSAPAVATGSAESAVTRVLRVAAPEGHLLIAGPELVNAGWPAVARARSVHIPKAMAVVVNDRRLAHRSRFHRAGLRLGRLAEFGPPTDLSKDRRLADLRRSRRRHPSRRLHRSPGRQSRLLGESTGSDAEHRDRTQSHTFPLHI
jgi:hypothetical protein